MLTVRRMAAARALWNAVRGARVPGAPGVPQRLGALPRMVVMSLTGRYPYLSRGRVALLGAAVFFLVSPVDRIPELLLPLLGFADDALIVAWIAGTVLAETDAFLRWEGERARTVVGQVV